MASKTLPSQEVLRQLLDYNSATGALTWRARGAEWFKDGTRQKAADFAARWNSAYAGKEALASVNRGYKVGTMFGGHCAAHRVIWLMMIGNQPDHIDHINGNTLDNRLQNLRSVTKAENARNQKRRKDNSSGLVGIHKAKSGAWVVQAQSRYVSSHFCLGKAIRARKAAERAIGFHENHGRAA